MRVIAGRFKGRTLITPKGMRVRPTADRVRESIFNILGPTWTYHTVLDLFAGTGALGIEALSRGADSVVFVEHGRDASRVLRTNLHVVEAGAAARIIPVSATRAIRLLADEGAVFDLIFMDPPYGKRLVDGTLTAIVNSAVLAPDGIVVAEHGRTDLVNCPNSLEQYLQRRYGDTAVSFIRARATAS
jgi:16S rRNA (guanine(966)-N(2))-methyltransferase RsmD